MTEARAAARVGPVLRANALGRAVLEAIRVLNPAVEVRDQGSYLRVLSSGSCRLTREAVERVTGDEFRLPGDLETVMPSFQGYFSVDADHAEWKVDRS